MDTDQDLTRVVAGGDAPEAHVAADAPLPVPRGPLPKGTEVGRYVLLERVGRGGMGEVYAAYDPELDRRIALKVLAPSHAAHDSNHDDGGEARLVREAQAMAKVSHPGVVQVYDAGSAGGHLFIAMEFIDGGTLREWLDETKRSLPDILRVLGLAGEGLAAAHREGLVHRDFKPANVMVRSDGVVRVLDFGLARRVDGRSTLEDCAASHSHPGLSDAVSPRDSMSAHLTKTGLVHGTPAYMAPEQFSGGTVDALSDQFGFCIVAYEALYGERPFANTSYADLGRAVARGEVAEAPRGSHVPLRVRRVLLRGLTPDPQQRHTGMEALLRALRDAVLPRWRRPAIFGAGGGVFLAAGLTASSAAAPAATTETACAGADEKIAAVWNDERKAAIATAFDNLALPYAEATWLRVETIVDTYAQQWAAMRADACQATRVIEEQSEDLMDRRITCLDRHLAELSTLTDLLAEVDPGVAEKAVAAANALTPAHECSAEAVLRSPAAPPSDPTLRARVAELDQERASGGITVKAGRFAPGRERLLAVLEEAKALGHEPLIAEVAFDVGSASYAMGDAVAAKTHLTDALLSAIRCNHESIELRAHMALAGVVGAYLADPVRGREHARIAEVLAERVDGGPTTLGMLDTFVGLIELQAGNPELALARFEQAIADRNEALGTDSPETVPLVINSATSLAAMARNDEATQRFREAIAILDGFYGGNHPLSGTARINLGTMQTRTGDIAGALQTFGQSIAILDRAYPDGSLHLAQALHNRAAMLVHDNDLKGAQTDLERAVAMKTAMAGADNPSTALSLGNLADLELRRGRFDKALEQIDRVIPVLDMTMGSSPSYAAAYLTRAEALLGLDRAQEAEAAAATGTDKLGERGEPSQRAEARWLLARARRAVATNERERDAADALARESIAMFAELGQPFDDHRARIAGWLSER